MAFGFHQLHIVQSLRPGELRWGEVLRAAIHVGVPESANHIQLRDAPDKAVFRAQLGAIYDELTGSGRVPFLHLECHGTPDGLVLSSDDLVTWDDLIDLLTPISIASRLNLFVSFASCHGQSLAGAIRLKQPAPLRGLLGARTEQTAGFMSDFFKTFFVQLLTTTDLDLAVERAGGGPPSVDRPMVLWPADYFFVQVFINYLREFGTEEQIANRADRLATMVQLRDGLPSIAQPRPREGIAAGLRNHEEHFNRFLRTYLMLDWFPENEARFQLDWRIFLEIQAKQSSTALSRGPAA